MLGSMWIVSYRSMNLCPVILPVRLPVGSQSRPSRVPVASQWAPLFQTYRLVRRENRNTYIRRQTDPATTTQLRCLLFPRKVERERQNPENPQNPLHSLRSFHSRPKASLYPSHPP